MKSIIKSFVAAIVFLLASHNASATGYWSEIETVYVIYPTATSVLVRLDASTTSHPNSNQCEHAHYYIMDNNSPRFKEQYQLLLTSLASDKRVRIWSTECFGSYALLKYVQTFRS